MAVRVIKVDASGWKRPPDVDEALKIALGYPGAASRGADAWIDNLLYGNMIEPPCRIEIDGADNLDETTYYYLMLIQSSVGHARLEKFVGTGVDTDVTISVFG